MQPQLPTRSTDATRLDNPTAGGSFFPAPAVTPLALDTSALSRPRVRPHRLRQPALAHPPAAICGVPLAGETTAPPFSTSASSFRLLPCGDSSDTPFSTVLAGTAGWRHLLRPGGAALLCFPATRDPSGFRSFPKRLAIICLGRTANLLSVPPEKAELGLGSTHHLLYSAPRESGAEKDKKVYVSKPRFHHRVRRNDAQLRSSKNGAPVAVFSVAKKSSWKNAKGGCDSRTEWHRCVAWGSLCQFAAKLEKGAHLSKGDDNAEIFSSAGAQRRRCTEP